MDKTTFEAVERAHSEGDPALHAEGGALQQFNIRLPGVYLEALRMLAEEAGVTRTRLAEYVLRAYVLSHMPDAQAALETEIETRHRLAQDLGKLRPFAIGLEGQDE